MDMQGLIPADGELWKARRRAVLPALHRRWVQLLCITEQRTGYQWPNNNVALLSRPSAPQSGRGHGGTAVARISVAKRGLCVPNVED